LELGAGQVTRLTNTPAYDASPSWSPDGLWMAYETYVDDFGGNLEVNILSLNDAQTPMRLTEDPAADFAPAWSPQGRQIAFVSTRSGQKEIWLADLNQVENRFRNLGHTSSLVNDHPVWSSDGNWLAWSASVDGTQTILVLDNTQPDARPHASGSGDWPAWSPVGDVLVTAINEPNKTYLTGYSSQSPGLALSPLSLNGSLHGLSWGNTSLLDHILAVFAQTAQVTPPPIWQPALNPVDDMPAGRQRLISLNDVEAPNPSLQDLVDESFQALRQKVAQVAGWDFLSSLENAYVPLTSPLAPGMNEDWLFTGRAFAINPLPVNAGWVVIAREDFGARTYWRIYLKARFQDGSQGMPLHELPWDLSARFGGNPRFYEQGGELMKSVPVGYWVDFTQQAIAFGWERQSALSTWRQVFATTRFNEFALTDGLAWITAMEEIYPPEALVTLTPPPPPSDTPTASPIPTRTPVPTRTPWLSPTPRPTRTPWPTATSKPTRTPRITASPTVLPAASETFLPLTPQ
jgi:TolB protein